jgi:hypothetical protein
MLKTYNKLVKSHPSKKLFCHNLKPKEVTESVVDWRDIESLEDLWNARMAIGFIPWDPAPVLISSELMDQIRELVHAGMGYTAKAALKKDPIHKFCEGLLKPTKSKGDKSGKKVASSRP